MKKGFEVFVRLQDEKNETKYIDTQIYVNGDVIKYLAPSPGGGIIGFISGEVMRTKEEYAELKRKFEGLPSGGAPK